MEPIGNRLVEVRCSLRPKGRAHNGEGSSAKSPEAAEALLNPGKLPRITHTVAQAILFEDLLARGEAADHADLARLGGLTRERVSQIMKMLWLAPDIQEEILGLAPVPRGEFSIIVPEIAAITAEVLWEEQRERWRKLKRKKNLSD